VVGAAIGRMIMADGKSLSLTLLVGLAIVMVAVNLPMIGGIVAFIFTIIGLGMLVQFLFSVVSTPEFNESASG